MSPVMNGIVEPENARALWRLAEPHLKQCLAEVHLREDGLTFQAKPTATAASTEMTNVGAGTPSKHIMIEHLSYSRNASSFIFESKVLALMTSRT